MQKKKNLSDNNKRQDGRNESDAMKNRKVKFELYEIFDEESNNNSSELNDRDSNAAGKEIFYFRR